MFQSAPLRLGLGLVALFTIVSFASFAVSFWVARSTLETTIRETLFQDFAGFRAAPSAVAVATLVRAQGEAMDPANRIISYVDIFGRMHGNGAIVRTKEGFEAIALDRDDNVAKTYFALTESIHGGFLTLAASTDARATLRQTMLIVLVFSLLPTIVIAFGGGYLIARRSAHRMSAVETTLNSLTSGDLSARVPKIKGAEDDLSIIARQVDTMAAAHEENVAALRQVSADIAHDLKTPIQRVGVLLERARTDDASLAQKLIEEAVQETKGIIEIFQSLLQIAQLEGGGGKNAFREVVLSDLIADVADLYTPLAEEKGHRLTVETKDPATVFGDRTALGQLLANLIENAFRHAGPNAEVTISIEGRALKVADRGPGIPENMRGQVLRRLFRLEQSRTTPGSGLGLSLVKAIANIHGARLSLRDNEPGLRVRILFADPGNSGQN